MAREAKSPAAGGAEEAGGSRPSLVRRLFRMACWCGALALALFGLSNLWLWSSWGAGTAEAELEKRTGQEWEIGSMSWSPWNGITLYDVRMLQPGDLRAQLDAPVLDVEKLRVRPYWMQLARGAVVPQEVEIDSPHLTVSVEMLAQLASRTVAPPATNQPAPPPAPKPPQPAAPGPPAPEPARGQPRLPQPAPPPPKPRAQGPEPVPAGLPVHLKVTNACCRLVSATRGLDVLSVEGLDYDQVLMGEDTAGEVRIGRARLLGLLDCSGVRQKLVWKRPYLEFEEQTVDLGGVEARAIAQLGLLRSGMGRFPFLLDLAVDPQEIRSAPWLEHVAMVVDAGALHARGRISGLLAKPDTWRADGMLSAEDLSVRERHGNHHITFAEVRVPAVCRQGALRWSGVRFISEDVSILGNGTVSLRDGHLSVTRIVASPEAAAVLERGVRGSHIVDDRARWWYDLGTPDRKVRDLVVSGPLLEPEIDAGAHYGPLPLVPMLASMYDFIRQEMKESGKELKALPAPLERRLHASKP